MCCTAYWELSVRVFFYSHNCNGTIITSMKANNSYNKGAYIHFFLPPIQKRPYKKKGLGNYLKKTQEQNE